MDKSTDGLAADRASNDKSYGSADAESSGGSSSEENARGNWGGRVEFLLSCIGYAVGLGNVWRFPYLAYRNGGGLFLIPYVIMLLICGIPLFFMELAFGQFVSQGPITMWRAVPLFKGVGWGMVVVSFMVGIYYNVIIAWTIYYFFASMTSKLPWEFCDKWWNTQLCAKVRGVAEGSTEILLHKFNGEVYSAKGLNDSYLNRAWVESLSKSDNSTDMVNYFDDYNVTCFKADAENVTCNLTSYPISQLRHFGLKLVSPAEEYWDNRVLRRSASINETGEVLWDLALCLFLGWIVIYLCLIKGVKSSGKVVYFTATFPYIVLTILLIRGCLLEGAYDGIKFYMGADLDRLNDASVWKDAATQIFYSLGVGFGGLAVMSSYNKFHNNCLADSLIVSLINCGTSVYAGFAIFSMVGFLSAKTGVPVPEAATSGPGLAFVAYPEGITQMPVAPLWSLLFFFMLFTLGLDSQFAFVETVISGLADEFPILHAGSWKVWRLTIPRKMVFTGVICFVMFLLGLPMTTRGGVYWFQIIDSYSAGHCLLLIVIFEIIGLCYVYGIKNFLADIELMLGHKHIAHWMYFIVCWLVLSPIALAFIFIFASVDYSPVSYDGEVMPQWAESVGWLIACSSMLMLPLWFCVVFCEKSGLYKYVIEGAKPAPEWGPILAEDREGTRYERPKGAGNGRTQAETKYNNEAYETPAEI